MEHRAALLTEVMTRVDQAAPGSGLAKHVKMASSPFVMLRGASSVFYEDFAQEVVTLPESIDRWPLTMIVGDCHVSNFGFFSEEGSHGDEVIFAPNDFDDACVGKAGWDLLRFGVSLLLCADHGQGVLSGKYARAEPIEKSSVVGAEETQTAVTAFLESYVETCGQLAQGQRTYNQVVREFDEDHLLSKLEQKARKRANQGADFASKSSLAKAVDLQQSPLRFRDRTERFRRLDAREYHAVQHAFSPYVDDRILDIVARLGAGTGSVNMERYYLLVGPNEIARESDWPLYHVVEVKKQRAAAPLHRFADLSPVNRLNHAHLTLTCQRRMQRNPDLVLDEVVWRKAHWLVRSRHHARVGIDPEHIVCGKRACKGGFSEYARACGTALALAHGRSDRRSQCFEQCVAETSKQSLTELTEQIYRYTNQVKQDWEWLVEREGLL